MAYPLNTATVLRFLGYEPLSDFVASIRGGVVSVLWSHADPQPTEQEVIDAGGDATVVNGQVYSEWQAENGGDPVLTKRRGARETRFDDEVGVSTRQLIELMNKRDNNLTTRVKQLQDTLAAMKATTGGTATMRAAIPGSFLATQTRPRADAIQDYQDGIDAGESD